MTEYMLVPPFGPKVGWTIAVKKADGTKGGEMVTCATRDEAERYLRLLTEKDKERSAQTPGTGPEPHGHRHD